MSIDLIDELTMVDKLPIPPRPWPREVGDTLLVWCGREGLRYLGGGK